MAKSGSWWGSASGNATGRSRWSNRFVKIDGDGQMDPALINRFVPPILRDEADYTKGNRFYDLEPLQGMPLLRLIGNAALSFISVEWLLECF